MDANAIDRLQCFKNAMVNVSRNLSRSHTNLEAATAVGDKLGVTMKLIRAVEKGSAGEINVCRQLHTGIDGLLSNPYTVNGNLSRHLEPLKQHALELHSQWQSFSSS